MDPNTALREALELLIDVAEDKGDTDAKTFLAAEQFENLAAWLADRGLAPDTPSIVGELAIELGYVPVSK